jgi:hypothetical protein
LAHFGKDGKPAQMQGWIKEQFGIEMTTDHISTAKGTILSKKGRKAKKAAPKPQVQLAAASTSPAKASGGGKAGGIPLEDILAVKELVGRLGARPLHTLIDAFAK